MSAAVTLNLSINYTLIELLCTFVNLEEIRKEIYKMILKKESRIFFFQQNSSCYIKLAPPPFPMHPSPLRTPLHIPDLKCNLERVPDSTFFSSDFRSFHVSFSDNHFYIFNDS